jgi:hypothetical protein
VFGLQRKQWAFHKITAGATCTKDDAYKEQTAEFFEEASALNTDAENFDVKKLIFSKIYGVWKHTLTETANARFSFFLGKVLQANYSRPVYTSNTLSTYLL